MEFQTGDIICVRGKGWLSKTIRWFSRSRNEALTYANHIAIVKDRYTVSEALWTVKETEIYEWMEKHKNFQVWRFDLLTDAEKDKIYKYLCEYKGNFYGGWKLLFFAGDLGLTKLFGKEMYIFRKMLFIDYFPICSWLATHAYAKAGYRFRDFDPNYLDPDTMHDIIMNNGRWKMLCSYRN